MSSVRSRVRLLERYVAKRTEERHPKLMGVEFINRFEQVVCRLEEDPQERTDPIKGRIWQIYQTLKARQAAGRSPAEFSREEVQ
jgi:hypothetical protein